MCSILIAVTNSNISYAVSPHFITGSTSATINASEQLFVNVKIAGLGRNVSYEWTIDGSLVKLTAGCRNCSGKYPNGTQKFTGESLGYFESNSDSSNAAGALTVSTLLNPSSISVGSCPLGQTWTVRSKSGSVMFNLHLDSTKLFQGSIAVS